jgi:hypothetical protein
MGLTVAEMADFLEENHNDFYPGVIKTVIQEYGIQVEENLELFVSGVVLEGTLRTVRATHKLFEALGIPPQAEVEKLLWGGVNLKAHYPGGEKTGFTGELTVGAFESGDRVLRFPFFVPPELRGEAFTLRAHYGFGLVRLDTKSGLVVSNRNAILRTSNPENVETALNTAKALRPFFSAIGLEDLESALQALASLREGEARMEGPYVVARMGGVFALRKGLMLGDPYLDGVLLTKGQVTMAFPGDVEISLEAFYNDTPLTMRFPRVHIRLGEEEVSFVAGFFEASIFKKDPVAKAIQRGLAGYMIRKERMAPPYDDPSPRMLAFLNVLAQHEEPFKALAEGRFFPHVTAELFSQI